MVYRLLADAVVLLHCGFVLFVVLGGLLVLRWRKLIWMHLPAATWGFLVEARGWICPLTGLENRFRRLAGQAGYDGGFIEHYVMPMLYPVGLTRELQWSLAAAVLVINAVFYGVFWRQRKTSSDG